MGQSLDGLSFSLCSTLCPCISFRQEQFWVKILEMGRWPHLSTGGLCLTSTGSSSRLYGISANVIPMGSWEALAFLASETFWLLPPAPHPPLLHTSVQFPDPLYTSSISCSYLILPPFPLLLLSSSQVPPTLYPPLLYCSPF